MFNKIKIGPEGVFVKYVGGSYEERESAEWKPVPGNYLLPYMGSEVELTEDCTFADIWKCIEADSATYEVIFSDPLGGYSLDSWIDDSKKDFEPDGTYDYLYISRTLELENYKDDDRCFSPFVHFGGYGPWDIECEDIQDEGGVAVDFTPISELMRVPVRLNNEITIEKWNHGETDIKKLIEKDGPYKTEFTWYEIVEAILFEISFMGNPSERDEKREGLVSAVAESKENIKKADGDLAKAGFKRLSDVLNDMQTDANEPT